MCQSTNFAKDQSQTLRYLQALFGRHEFRGNDRIVIAEQVDGGPVRVHPGSVTNDIGAAAEFIEAFTGSGELFIKTSLYDADKMLARSERNGNSLWMAGQSDELTVVTAGVLDGDAGKPGYLTREQMLEAVARMSIPPTMIVSTRDGCGFHFYWILRVPVIVRDAEQLREINRRFASLQRELEQHVKAIDPDAKLDAVYGAERVVRPVGSKRSNGDAVTLYECHQDRLYDLDELSMTGWGVVPEPVHRSADADSGPIERYIDAEGITVADLLAEIGCTDRGDGTWTRPGDGVTAKSCVEYDHPEQGRNGITVYSKNWELFGERPGQSNAWYSDVAVFVTVRFSGDWTAAASFCRKEMPIDMSEVFDVITVEDKKDFDPGFTREDLDQMRVRRSIDTTQKERCALMNEHLADQENPNPASLAISYDVDPEVCRAIFGVDPVFPAPKHLLRGEGLVAAINSESWNCANRIARHMLVKYGYAPLNQRALTLRYHLGVFWKWDGVAYRTVDTGELMLEAREAADALWIIEADWRKRKNRERERKAIAAGKDVPKPIPAPEQVKPALVKNCVDALATITSVGAGVTMPAWIADGDELPDPRNVITFRNVMLHILRDGSTQTAKPSTNLFSSRGVDYDYDCDARCPLWEETLREWFGDDTESIELLQEWFGYHLTAECDLHKILFIIGVTRSGKGVIQRILSALMGKGNVSTPAMSSLGGEFGLESSLDKMALHITDARAGFKLDRGAAVERLLAISGGDPVDVNRKNIKAAAEQKLNLKISMFSNMAPSLRDDSGALAGRFLFISMRNSFTGREDLGRAKMLAGEISGIFNWALVGLARLRERGHFIEPESSRAQRETVESMFSPLRRFLDDRCTLYPDAITPKADIYMAYREWCPFVGQTAKAENVFFRDLYSTEPSLLECRPRVEGDRVQSVKGIRINPQRGATTSETGSWFFGMS
ncbi:DNA primase family protein [Novipirellula artificiosorum]|nr:phage/plasmid primase, P4 family [Novipirellula artificiosorum]